MQYQQRRTGNASHVHKKRIFTPADIEQEPASPHRAGHYAGLHAEDTPHVTTAEVRQQLAPRPPGPAYEPDEREFTIHSILKRYNGTPMPDGVLIPAGKQQYYLHNSPPPVTRRASRTTAQHQIPQQAASLHQPGKGLRFHWLFFV